jgi:hypothetical protein
VTLEISRAECNIDVTPGTLTATDTCIGYHVTRFEASRKDVLYTPYVSTCVGAGGGRSRGTKIKTKANRCGPCYYSIMFLTCDKHKSSLRHIHDPVLLSLKMKGLIFLFSQSSVLSHPKLLTSPESLCMFFIITCCMSSPSTVSPQHPLDVPEASLRTV